MSSQFIENDIVRGRDYKTTEISNLNELQERKIATGTSTTNLTLIEEVFKTSDLQDNEKYAPYCKKNPRMTVTHIPVKVVPLA